MLVELLARLFEFMVVVWVLRFLVSSLMGGGVRARTIRQYRAGAPFQTSRPAQSPSEPKVISGEMKKDPECGTYVSTELSLKSRYGSEVIHFCSRECQEEFLKTHSSKSA
jgi:YHS domain-containing protein